MHMVRHHLQPFHLYIQRRRFLVEKFFEACFYGVHQYRFAVLGTPDQMQMQVENAPCVLAVSCFAHSFKIPRC